MRNNDQILDSIMNKITEPMTMITDYIITGYCFFLSFLLFKSTNFNQAILFMALALISTGIGAFVGGTSHGFKLYLGEKLNSIIWKMTLYTIGISSVFFIIGATLSSVKSQILAIVIIGFGVIGFFIYAYWMIDHNQFKYVIMDYGSAMLLVIILKVVSYFMYQDSSSLWIIGGILVTIIASVIQAMGITIHPKYFNHNDLFHVVQLPGIYLLYRGSLIMIQLV